MRTDSRAPIDSSHFHRDSVRRHHDYMVTLRGNNFHIMSITDSIQHLYPSAVTIWKWEVTPQSSEANELTVIVAGFSDSIKSRLDHLLTRNIKIKVSFIQNIQELSSTEYGYATYGAILASIGWLYQNRRKKKKNQDA